MSDEPELPGEVVKVGNLTSDLALNYSASGLAYVKGGLAWQPYDPSTRERGETVFYDLTVFGDLGEHAAESLLKGMRVIVVGRPEIYRPEPSEEFPDPQPRRQIVVSAIGPDLRWQTCLVDRVKRKESVPRGGPFDDGSTF